MINQKVIKNASYFSRYVVKYRREREKKTRYVLRHKLRPINKKYYTNKKYRCFFRISNLFCRSALNYPSLLGDVIIVESTTNELTTFGIESGFKNLLTCYFLGILLSRKAILKLSLYSSYSPIFTLDLGFHKISFGGRANAFLKVALIFKGNIRWRIRSTIIRF